MNTFGKDNAEQLQQTIFFFASKLFGLRGCDEHHDLQSEQLEVGVDSNKQFIRFFGRATKTYKGGLGQMNISNKDIKHYCEPGNRCIADFFSLYLNALGGNDSFYRTPLPPIPGNTIRFSNQNIGINKLKTFMKSICEKGGLEGQFRKHDGKRTCATQLYRADVEEQDIMQITGHRSPTTIRKYKRSNDEICAKVSRVLDPPQPNVSDIPNKNVCTSQENVLTECFKDQSEKNILTEHNADQGHGTVFNNCEIHYWNLTPTQL